MSVYMCCVLRMNDKSGIGCTFLYLKSAQHNMYERPNLLSDMELGLVVTIELVNTRQWLGSMTTTITTTHDNKPLTL